MSQSSAVAPTIGGDNLQDVPTDGHCMYTEFLRAATARGVASVCNVTVDDLRTTIVSGAETLCVHLGDAEVLAACTAAAIGMDSTRPQGACAGF